MGAELAKMSSTMAIDIEAARDAARHAAGDAPPRTLLLLLNAYTFDGDDGEGELSRDVCTAMAMGAQVMLVHWTELQFEFFFTVTVRTHTTPRCTASGLKRQPLPLALRARARSYPEGSSACLTADSRLSGLPVWQPHTFVVAGLYNELAVPFFPPGPQQGVSMAAIAQRLGAQPVKRQLRDRAVADLLPPTVVAEEISGLAEVARRQPAAPEPHSSSGSNRRCKSSRDIQSLTC
jgi:hypothetical protein